MSIIKIYDCGIIVEAYPYTIMEMEYLVIDNGTIVGSFNEVSDDYARYNAIELAQTLVNRKAQA